MAHIMLKKISDSDSDIYFSYLQLQTLYVIKCNNNHLYSLHKNQYKHYYR